MVFKFLECLSWTLNLTPRLNKLLPKVCIEKWFLFIQTQMCLSQGAASLATLTKIPIWFDDLAVTVNDAAPWLECVHFQSWINLTLSVCHFYLVLTYWNPTMCNKYTIIFCSFRTSKSNNWPITSKPNPMLLINGDSYSYFSYSYRFCTYLFG